MRDYACLPVGELDRFVQRSRASSALPAEPDMAGLLRQILQKAAELVPSEAGAILLDEPLRRAPAREDTALSFVAAFGPNSQQLIGRTLVARDGVAGHVYRTGAAYLSVDSGARAGTDGGSSTKPDEAAGDVAGRRTRSIIAAPIQIGRTICGTIELLNRKDGRAYDPHDLMVLEVFASYTASSLQNALDARHAHELAKIDDLTGLFNDRYLHVRLREELARAAKSGAPCALLFIDLDRFKPVNDTHGHLVGSQVLREVGYLLRRVTADADVVLARYGGDEFTVVLPGRTEAQAAVLAERIRSAVAEAAFLERSHGPDLPALHLENAITASVGVAAVCPNAGMPADPASWLIRAADEAMYRAKGDGKNRVAAADGR